MIFSFLQISKACSLKSICLVAQGKLEEDIHKPIQYDVVMEIRWKFHCQVVATHTPTSALKVEEKEEVKNLLKWRKVSFYVIEDREIFTYLRNKN